MHGIFFLNFCTNTYTFCCLQGTFLRCKRLQAIWNFPCNCVRCANPAELGSNLSSLHCPKCDPQPDTTTAIDGVAGWFRTNHWTCRQNRFARSVVWWMDNGWYEEWRRWTCVYEKTIISFFFGLVDERKGRETCLERVEKACKSHVSFTAQNNIMLINRYNSFILVNPEQQ